MLVSNSGRHSDRDKSYSGERDFPRKRTSPTPHQANQKCRKTALTAPLGHILAHPLRYGSIEGLLYTESSQVQLPLFFTI